MERSIDTTLKLGLIMDAINLKILIREYFKTPKREDLRFFIIQDVNDRENLETDTDIITSKLEEESSKIKEDIKDEIKNIEIRITNELRSEVSNVNNEIRDMKSEITDMKSYINKKIEIILTE